MRAARRSPHVRRALRLAGIVAVLAVAVVTLHDKLPDPAQTWQAVRSADLSWLLLAFIAELTSLRHFALQQRRLLAGFGVGMSVPRAVAVTFSRTAIAFSLPAGSAVSAGFAFRQYRIVGASRRTAAAVTLLSGVLSGAALVVMYGLMVLIPQDGPAGDATTATVVLGALVVAMLVFTVDWALSRQPCVPVAEPEGRPAGRGTGPAGWIARLIGTARRTLASLRELPPRSWVLSMTHATVNWTLDFACLAATAAAFDLDVSLTRLATVYLTVQLVRQIPLSPGGLGVVEVALLAGLISAGAPEGAAAGAMLIYRLFSCWIIIPTGALAYAILRRPGDEKATDEPDREHVTA